MCDQFALDGGSVEFRGKTTRQFISHTKDVLSVAFSADNRQIVSGSRDKKIKLWNTLAQCKHTIEEVWSPSMLASLVHLRTSARVVFSARPTPIGSPVCASRPLRRTR